MRPGEDPGAKGPLEELIRRFGEAVKAVAVAASSVRLAVWAIRDLVVYVASLVADVASLVSGDWRSDRWVPRVGVGGLGISGAVTNGFGLVDSRFVVVGGFVLCLPLLQRGFYYLRMESSREHDRRLTEAPSTNNLVEELNAEIAKRRWLAEMMSGPVKPPLEDRASTAEVLEYVRELGKSARPSLDVSFVLVKSVGRGYRVVCTRGPVEDTFKLKTTWTRDEVFSGGEAFAELVSGYGLMSTVVHFDLGPCDYFLVGIAGSVFSPHMISRSSRAATVLVESIARNSLADTWRRTVDR